MRCNELRRTRRGKLSQTCQSNSPGVQVRRSQSKTQSAFHSAHDETLSVAMGVSNPVCSPIGRLPPRLPLGLYHYWCAEADGVIKLARFPIRHSNASVRRRHPWQVALVQSVARRELEKVGHRGAHEVRMGRFGVTPGVDIGLHDSARVIDVVTIETGSMILVLANHLKATNRSAVSFATTGYARRRGSIPSAIKIGFLRPQTYDD